MSVAMNSTPLSMNRLGAAEVEGHGLNFPADLVPLRLPPLRERTEGRLPFPW
jgi:hypothetical protein